MKYLNTMYQLEAESVPNPLLAGAVHIRFVHFILAHYKSAFKPVEDKKSQKSARFENF